MEVISLALSRTHMIWMLMSKAKERRSLPFMTIYIKPYQTILYHSEPYQRKLLYLISGRSLASGVSANYGDGRR